MQGTSCQSACMCLLPATVCHGGWSASQAPYTLQALVAVVQDPEPLPDNAIFAVWSRCKISRASVICFLATCCTISFASFPCAVPETLLLEKSLRKSCAIALSCSKPFDSAACLRATALALEPGAKGVVHCTSLSIANVPHDADSRPAERKRKNTTLLPDGWAKYLESQSLVSGTGTLGRTGVLSLNMCCGCLRQSG